MFGGETAAADRFEGVGPHDIGMAISRRRHPDSRRTRQLLFSAPHRRENADSGANIELADSNSAAATSRPRAAQPVRSQSTFTSGNAAARWPTMSGRITAMYCDSSSKRVLPPKHQTKGGSPSAVPGGYVPQAWAMVAHLPSSGNWIRSSRWRNSATTCCGDSRFPKSSLASSRSSKSSTPPSAGPAIVESPSPEILAASERPPQPDTFFGHDPRSPPPFQPHL